MAAEQETSAEVMQSSRGRKWHRLYYVLAVFNVLVVCVGLYTTRSIVAIYVESVAVNQTWAERVVEFTRLGELAAAVNAPGNDVFGSRDAPREGERMRSALAEFQRQFRKVRDELQRSLPPEEAAPVLEKLDAVSRAMQAMTREARMTLAYFVARRPVAAANRMASMDRSYAAVNVALAELRASVAAAQRHNFEQQVAAATALKRYEYVIAALVLLMVLGATLYGQRIARQAAADAAERERHLAEISQAKAHLENAGEQKRAALRALGETHARLQALFKRTLEAEEQQRQHIARELHEDVSQMLASLKMRLGALEPPRGADAHVRDAGNIAESALHRLQNLVRDLTPHGMDLVGLAGVLPVHLEEWTRGSGIAVCFSERLRARASPRIENAAYRVAQEAVSNVLRHASARTLEVQLRSTASELELRVIDDGSGFDPKQARCHAALGLALMEQRTAALGGRLEIRSAPVRGTTVIAAFPLQQQIDWLGIAEPGAPALPEPRRVA